jgi:hypothetical protein
VKPEPPSAINVLVRTASVAARGKDFSLIPHAPGRCGEGDGLRPPPRIGAPGQERVGGLRLRPVEDPTHC